MISHHIKSNQNKRRRDLPSGAERGTFPLTSHNSPPESPDGGGGGGPSWASLIYASCLPEQSRKRRRPPSALTAGTNPSSLRCWRTADVKEALCENRLRIFILIQWLEVSVTDFLREPRIYFIRQPFLCSYWKWELHFPPVSCVDGGVMWRLYSDLQEVLVLAWLTSSRSSKSPTKGWTQVIIGI